MPCSVLSRQPPDRLTGRKVTANVHIDLLFRVELSSFRVAEQSDLFKIELSQNLNFFGRISTVSDQVGQSVTGSKRGRTNDQGTLFATVIFQMKGSMKDV